MHRTNFSRAKIKNVTEIARYYSRQKKESIIIPTIAIDSQFKFVAIDSINISC